MIEEKLEEARRRSARRRVQVVIFVVTALVLSCFVLFGLSLLEFPSDKYIQTSPAPGQSLSEEDREKKREKFKDMLQHYENELEPRLQSVNLELWDREAAFTTTELKHKVMEQFSAGNYGNALSTLQVLIGNTEQLLKEAEELYAENLSRASRFLAEDLYQEAKLHIEKALLVAPQEPAALQLQQQIEKLPTLLPLLDVVKTARVENDLDKEAEYLRQLLHLAPEREGAVERLQEVTEQLKRNKFAAHIASGFAALDKRQVREAGYHYQEAKKIDPGRSELAVLAGRLSSLEKSLRVSSAIKAAEQAVRQDDWQQARKYFSRVLADAPGNTAAINGLRRAEKVLELENQFRQYLNDPYRLSHYEVYTAAEKTLAQAVGPARYSFAIKKQAEQLRELLNRLSRLIPVTVVSDGQTNVLVRGVGRVGTISKKIINLKPGNYTFEGVRKGYKSKLLRVFIPYDRESFRVQVVCDEPI